MCDRPVQAAIVEVLVAKTVCELPSGSACDASPPRAGVICNSSLRRGLENACKEHGLRPRLAEPRYSTDNAAMIGILAEQKLLANPRRCLPTTPEIEPSWHIIRRSNQLKR